MGSIVNGPTVNFCFGRDLDQRGLVEQVMLFELALDVGQGELGGIHRHLDLAQHPGQAADVVLMPVGKDDGTNMLLVFNQIGDIGHDDIDARASSDSGNIRPASITIMSSSQRSARQFIPNSPSPPRGMIFSFFVCILSEMMLTPVKRGAGIRDQGSQGSEDQVLGIRDQGSGIRDQVSEIRGQSPAVPICLTVAGLRP